MPTYYLDIETTGLDPRKDQLLSIQTHRIENGVGVGEMKVHKAWHSDEETILREFLEETQFFKEPWTFIPVGFNLHYEMKWLFVKAQAYGLLPKFTRFEAIDKPRIDIKEVAMLMNNGQFKGAKLENFSPKMGSGDIVIKAIREGDYATIEHYIQQETQAFLDLYAALSEEMPRLWRERVAPRMGMNAADPTPYRRKPNPLGAFQ